VNHGALALERPTRIGLRWRPRDIRDQANWTGCEAVARVIRPKHGRFLGRYMGIEPVWFIHQVVVKESRVYDAFTGHQGISVADYKALWEDGEDLDFGF
jgi:hypothetical protein